MKSQSSFGVGFKRLAAVTFATCLFAALTSLAATAPTAPLLNRVVVMGASASAGFTAASSPDGPTGDQLRLSRYVDAALLAPHEPVKSVADLLLFLSPERNARRQLDQAQAMQPSLLVGVDYLFWFCYGSPTTNATRATRLETGLKLLESVSCPMVIGNIPDASGADKQMLDPKEIPTKAELEAANRRIKQWAAQHKNVIVLDLSKLMLQAASNRTVAVHGQKWPAGTSRALLQADGLHPTPAGCSMLALAALDAVCAANRQVPAKAIRWDAAGIQRLALAAPAAPARPLQIRGAAPSSTP